MSVLHSFYGRIISHCMDITTFYPLSVDGHLGCSHLLPVKLCLLDCGDTRQLCLMPHCPPSLPYTLVCGQGDLARAGHTPSPIEWPPAGPWTEQALMAFSPLGAAGGFFFHIKINAQSFLSVSPRTRGRRK